MCESCGGTKKKHRRRKLTVADVIRANRHLDANEGSPNDCYDWGAVFNRWGLDDGGRGVLVPHTYIDETTMRVRP